MSEPFATVEDIAALWRPLNPEEIARANALLPVVSDNLRQEAKNRGYDLDQMLEDEQIYSSVTKDITVAATARLLRSSTDGDPVSQFSQSALGYSVSGTYLNSSGSVYFTAAELRRLGITRQKVGSIEIIGGGNDPRNDSDAV